MPDPTLADVLAALERRKRAPPGQTIEALSFADLAGQYFDTNRAALGRFEAWRSQRNTERAKMPPEGTVAEMLHMLAYAEEPAIQYVMSGDGELLNESRARACGVVAVVEEWFRDNLVALERMELEQAARKFAGATAETPVIVRPGAIHPRLFVMGETLAVNDDVVLVGANWKPEIKP